MSGPRTLPWTDLVEALGGAPRLDAIKASLAGSGADPLDRDAFLLDAAVAQVLRDLVPRDAPAEALTSYGALLHALYAHWSLGFPVRSPSREALASVLAAPPRIPQLAPPGPCYVQLPERVVWASPGPGAAHEPMDGIFVTPMRGGVRALAVLGLRPERQGFTTIEAEIPVPGLRLQPRTDGSAPFATVLPAGERMGFYSVVTAPELGALALLALAAARG